MTIARWTSAGKALIASLVIGGALLVGLPLTTQSPTLMAQAMTELAAPSGEVLLTVSGALEVTNSPDHTAKLDRAMLHAMPQRTIKTSTIWTQGEQSFSGADLHELLAALGIVQGTIRVVALNNYAVEIPVAEIQAGGAILADLRNDLPMSVRDKGPLWIIYPYDQSEDFRTEVVYSRSVWQVDRIEVLP